MLAVATAVSQSAPEPSNPVRPVTSAQADEEIKALELKLANLIVHADWDEYEKLLGPDYTRVAYNGMFEDKKATMSSFRNGPRQYVVMEPEDLRVRTYGETAVLQGKLTISVRESGRLSSKVERFTQVFVKRDGRWFLTAEQETAVGK